MDLMGFHTCILKATTYIISHLQLVTPLEISGVYFGCVPKLRQTVNNKCKDFYEEYIFLIHNEFAYYVLHFMARTVLSQKNSSIPLSYLPTLIIDIYGRRTHKVKYLLQQIKK